MRATMSEAACKSPQLAVCVPMRAIHDCNAERAVVQVEDKVFPEIGLSASVRQQCSWAVELVERRQFVVMIKNELGRPALRLHIEADRRQPPTDARSRMRPAGRHVGSDQP